MQQIVPLTLPKNVPVQPVRRPQANIPQSKQERDQLAVAVRRYVEEREPVPPLSREELESHTDRVIQFTRSKAIYRDYLAVLISNEVWRETLATIPYERRLLLLPKCLRVEDKCPAPFDEFGLLCKQCGLCTIQDLQVEAERLGYAVLVAEGSAVVMAIVETGKIDAIVGVSCLSVLERAFPYMEAAAVPGIAIPLLQDDCRDTTVDLDWVWNVIHLSGDDRTRRLDLDALRDEVQSWFEPRVLEEMLGPVESDTEEIARAWLAKSGKRWRPFLTACAFQSFQEDPQLQIPADLQKIALSVECFHKASLVHDDIEDRDSSRYGEATLHEAHGVPVALNVGDLLLGEGYRMIAESQASPERKEQMLRAATQGHRSLCLGQGAELWWDRKPKPLTSLEVLEIFRRKTAPAFEVALRLGAVYAGADEEVWDAIRGYSEALGIAYQIRDDLADAVPDGSESASTQEMGSSILLSIAHEKARKEKKKITGAIWTQELRGAKAAQAFAELSSELKVTERTTELMMAYKEEAIRSLADLKNASLKGLLRRVVGKIFNDLEIKGWCSEFEARNAAGGEAGPDPVA